MIAADSKLFSDFFNSEKAGGFILIGCTIVSILLANSGIGASYLHFWHLNIGYENTILHLKHPIEYWINDGLMTIFFLLVGLEIEREIYIGELSTIKNVSLPFFAAVGGMIAPALIHFIINNGTATQSGFGIPMATDIAFALGILSLLGNKVPVSLKIFLTAFAIIDDLGAIIIIAIFYTETFSILYFGIALGIFVVLLIFNRLKISNLLFYLLPGITMWYCMLQSGVHATVSGVLLAFAIPFGKGDKASPSYLLQHWLHKPVAFIILPLFALANTGISFTTGWHQQLVSKNSIGILTGLIIGKPAGIMLLSFLAVKLKISSLAADINWKHILGAGILGGIGFTMSIFITLLAFKDGETIVGSKIAVLFSSVIAGLIGYTYLKITNKKTESASVQP
jgi:NhaA family Na+:H+ antiporter